NKAILGTLSSRIFDDFVIFIHPINNLAHLFEFVQFDLFLNYLLLIIFFSTGLIILCKRNQKNVFCK
ncbi:hypothetical protein NPM20_23955, partial [Vibrio parahaemolyticus]|uniref:hypothetical protein n=1 Tax=Vibrio parahaemolyticus TaxID=670 RepID=UPI002112610B